MAQQRISIIWSPHAWRKQLKDHKIQRSVDQFQYILFAPSNVERQPSYSCRRMVITCFFAFFQRHVNNREWMMTFTAGQRSVLFECDSVENTYIFGRINLGPVFQWKPIIFASHFMKKKFKFNSSFRNMFVSRRHIGRHNQTWLKRSRYIQTRK